MLNAVCEAVRIQLLHLDGPREVYVSKKTGRVRWMVALVGEF